MKIATAEDVYYVAAASDEPAAMWCRRWYEATENENARRFPGLPQVPVVPTPGSTASGPAAVAFVSDGAWVADCSNPNCWSAQVVADTDRRFFCVSCLNVHAGGAFVPVEWPAAGERERAETLLLARPSRFNMHWLAHRGETVEQLHAENHAHGVEVR